MSAVFADTYYFLAFLSERDQAHQEAVALIQTYNGKMVTTAWVITELADALGKVRRGSRFVVVHNFSQVFQSLTREDYFAAHELTSLRASSSGIPFPLSRSRQGFIE